MDEEVVGGPPTAGRAGTADRIARLGLRGGVDLFGSPEVDGIRPCSGRFVTGVPSSFTGAGAATSPLLLLILLGMSGFRVPLAILDVSFES